MDNHSDKPSIFNDLINYNKYAEGLAKVIVNADTPFTIGISGEWGYGKTTLMHFLSYHLDINEFNENKNSITDADKYDDFHKVHKITSKNCFTSIFLNTWPFINSKDIGESICEQMMIDLSKIILADKKWLNEGGKFILRTISGLVKTIKLNGKISVYGSEIGGEFDPSKFQMDNLRGNNTYSNFRSEIELILQEIIKKKGKLLIFIDDLDRLYPSQALEIIIFIKNFLSINNCIFIIGSDNKVVSDGLYQLYGRNGKNHFQLVNNYNSISGNRESTISGNSQNSTGLQDEVDEIFEKLKKNFFEKIYQLEFKIPGLNKKDIEKFLSSFKELSDLNNIEEIKSILEIFNPSFNPRKLKRIINQYLFISSLIESIPHEIKICIFEIAVIYEDNIENYNKLREFTINGTGNILQSIFQSDNYLMHQLIEANVELIKEIDKKNDILNEIFNIFGASDRKSISDHSILVETINNTTSYRSFQNEISSLNTDEKEKIFNYWIKKGITDNKEEAIELILKHSESLQTIKNLKLINDGLLTTEIDNKIETLTALEINQLSN